MYRIEERPTAKYWHKELAYFGARPDWEFVASYPTEDAAKAMAFEMRYQPKSAGYEYRVVEVDDAKG